MSTQSKLNNEQKLELGSLYLSGVDSSELSKRFGACSATILSYLRKQGIIIRSPNYRNKKYACDESFFQKIDSRNKAQILGFIAADGCLQRNKSYPNVRYISVHLQVTDKPYLEFIKNSLNYEGPLKDYMYQNKKNGKITHSSRIVINSPKIFDNLLNLGLTERKSLTLEFPSLEKVSEQFISSFVLGYFEGDGSFCARRIKKEHGKVFSVKFILTHEFGISLQNILETYLGFRGSLCKCKNTESNVWELSFGGNLQVLRFCEWIYKDSNYQMPRKYEIFKELKLLYSQI